MSFCNLRRSIPLLFNSFSQTLFKNHQTKHFSASAKLCVGAYDGQGQTTVSVINKEFFHSLLIDTVNQFGFRLNNGHLILGPLAIFNKAIFSWNVTKDEDISEESLSLFLYLKPKLDVFIIGLSDFSANHLNLSKVLNEIKRKHRCHFEVLPTERAIATFNFLSSEGRVVGAALLPPKKVTFTDEDYESSTRRIKDVNELDFKHQFI